MYDFKSTHVGKEKFRAKEHEEDIVIKNEISNEEFPVSLKAYGIGPLQLLTDKQQKMFPYLKQQGNDINERRRIIEIFNSSNFSDIHSIYTLPLIYDEQNKCCNILIFDYQKAMRNTQRILYVQKDKKFDSTSGELITRKGRIHPMYMFLDASNNYICEVRYGGATANALQRGFWTHTRNAIKYFESLTNGWIDYAHNAALVQLFRLALNATPQGHTSAQELLQQDIDILRQSL